MAASESPTFAGSPLAPGASKEEALDYYKRQYETLEAELAEFQQSSRELETELEKDITAAETRERQLKEKLEALNFEVEEWKGKHKQSKTEANTAQNKLQKEITELRDTNRSLTLKLRDMEVVNDDFERQARNTTSSLEDAESKFNSALERSVILEGEVKSGEQEREELRIEAQRLREELSDLKVEAEIRQEKLRLAEAAAEQARESLYAVPDPIFRPESSVSDHSPTTDASPGMATPPAKSVSSATSEDPTIPSPMRMEKTAVPSHVVPPKMRPSMGGITPRATQYARPPRASRTSIPGPGGSVATPAVRRTTLTRPDTAGPASSLSQVRGLISKMAKLEARVHNARSKLPAPTATPPRASPRPASGLSNTYLPTNVTVRSSRKRSTATASTLSGLPTPSESSDPNSVLTPSAGRERPGSRLSYGQHAGIGASYSNFNSMRPSSRQSLSSRQSISHLPSATTSSRPGSRQSMSGAKTPLGDAGRIIRPRSSAAGTYSAMHGARQSISQLSHYDVEEESPELNTALVNGDDVTTPTPARRQSGIPAPSKRASLGHLGRRTSDGPNKAGDMGPPAARKKMSALGETY